MDIYLSFTKKISKSEPNFKHWTLKSAVNSSLLPRAADCEPLRQARVPASLPLAIMLVATSLIVDCEGPEEVMVVTRQALSESQ